MPITKTESGAIMITGSKEIELYGLLALRGAVRLENLGLRSSRRSATATAKQRFGLSRSMPRVRVLDYLEETIADLEAQLGLTTQARPEGGRLVCAT